MYRNFLFALKKAWTSARNKNVQIGQGVRMDWSTKVISCGNRILIGNDVYLRSRAKFYQAGMPFPTTLLTDVKGAFISIGNNSRINGAYIHAQKGISIGSNCVIASGVNIMDSNGHELLSPDRTKKRDVPSEITIGDNVWIGLNVIILKGTKIGRNAVVAAGSVVKGEFPDNALISGNPAKYIKTLEIHENSTPIQS